MIYSSNATHTALNSILNKKISIIDERPVNSSNMHCLLKNHMTKDPL